MSRYVLLHLFLVPLLFFLELLFFLLSLLLGSVREGVWTFLAELYHGSGDIVDQ